MKGPLYSEKEAKNIIESYLMPKRAMRRSKKLDIYHSYDKSYKDIDWSSKRLSRKEATKIATCSQRFRSFFALLREGFIRATRRYAVTDDLRGVFLMREVCSQMDDAYWLAVETKWKDAAKEKKGKQRTSSTQRKIQKLSPLKLNLWDGMVLDGFPRRYPLENQEFQKRLEAARECIMKNRWVLDQKHPLRCRRKLVARYLDENFLKAGAVPKPIQEWAEEHCWARDPKNRWRDRE